MADKTPAEQLAEENARLAISQKYLARDDNPDLDPFRQDQIDKNRIPLDIGSEQLSPNSERRTVPRNFAAQTSAGVSENFSTALTKSAREQPYVTLGSAALVGFVLGAIWKA